MKTFETFVTLSGLVAGCFIYAFFADQPYLVAFERSFWIVVGGVMVSLLTRNES